MSPPLLIKQQLQSQADPKKWCMLVVPTSLIAGYQPDTLSRFSMASPNATDTLAESPYLPAESLPMNLWKLLASSLSDRQEPFPRFLNVTCIIIDNCDHLCLTSCLFYLFYLFQHFPYFSILQKKGRCKAVSLHLSLLFIFSFYRLLLILIIFPVQGKPKFHTIVIILYSIFLVKPFHNSFYNGKPNTAASIFSGPCFVYFVELVPEFRQICLRNRLSKY